MGPPKGGACRDSNGVEPPKVNAKNRDRCGDGSTEKDTCRSQALVDYCADECDQSATCHSFQVLHGIGKCMIYVGGGSCDPSKAKTLEWWWKVYEKRQVISLVDRDIRELAIQAQAFLKKYAPLPSRPSFFLRNTRRSHPYQCLSTRKRVPAINIQVFV